MKSVQEIAEEIVSREGGFVNDKDDPGGATKHGVTIGTMRRLGLDLNKDGRVTAGDVKLLTRAQAVDIFITHFFEAPGISELPDELQASVFDMQVNAGSNAVKILQRLIVGMGFDCRADGQIGPQTIRLAYAARNRAPRHIADAYGIARRNYYYALGDARPRSRKFARRRNGGKGGWVTRAEEFISPRFHLTDAEHQARTAKWH